MPSEQDLAGPTLPVLACRPTNPNDYPEAVRAELIALMERTPLDPGFLDMQCQVCGMDIQMGPRQRSQYELAPEDWVVVDFLCVARIHAGLPTTITHLGGK